MHSVPSLDLSSVQIPDDSARPLAEYTVPELKDELIRRGCADFSKWDVAIKMGPWLVLILAFTLLKLRHTFDGTLFACLFG